MLSSNLLKSGSVSSFAALCAFLGNILMARYLNHEIYGKVALIITVFNLISLVATLGQPAVLKREILQGGHFPQLKKDAGIFLLISTPLSILLTIISSYWYKLNIIEMCFLSFFSVCTAFISYGIVLLDCSRQFALSSLIQRLPIALILLLSPAFILNISFTYLQMLFFLGLFFMITMGVIALRIFNRKLDGTLIVNWESRKIGGHFVLLSLTNILPFYGISAIAGKIAPVETFAIFSAVMLFQRPFYILNNLLNRMLVVTWKISTKITMRDYFGVVAIGTFLAISVITFKKEFVQLVFGDNFAHGEQYITPFMLTGLLVIVDSFPRNQILNFASQPLLRKFTVIQALTSLGILVYTLLMYQNILAIAWAGFALLIVKVSISYSFLLIDFKLKKP